MDLSLDFPPDRVTAGAFLCGIIASQVGVGVIAFSGGDLVIIHSSIPSGQANKHGFDDLRHINKETSTWKVCEHQPENQVENMTS